MISKKVLLWQLSGIRKIYNNENKENLFEKYGDCETDDQFFNVWDADDGPKPEDAWVFIRIKKS